MLEFLDGDRFPPLRRVRWRQGAENIINGMKEDAADPLAVADVGGVAVEVADVGGVAGVVADVGGVAVLSCGDKIIHKNICV